MMISIKKFVALALMVSLGIAAPMKGWTQDDASVSAEEDSFDPFADFSEFEASADEEADIFFFKNGRFFNLALLLGGRMWTQELGKLYTPSVAFGLYAAYFFDIRSAIQVSYISSSHKFTLDPKEDPGGYDGYNGNVNLSSVAVHYKYYFNTANITRGFADLNPYLIGGFSVNYRTITVTGEDILVKSNPTGVEMGFGLEIPFSRNKMYLGIQAMYHYINFPDENESLKTGTNGSIDTGILPQGDFVSALLSLGVNF
ncbi:MAG: hypothetical protein K2Q26_04085 [Bdellovibrionales bacterium]|nr:hypothetical protein [Bdellovibrionales bacterium]